MKANQLVQPPRWMNWLLAILLMLHVSMPSAGYNVHHVDHPHAHSSVLTQALDSNSTLEHSADFHQHDHQHALTTQEKNLSFRSLLATVQRLTSYISVLPSLLIHKIYKPPKNTLA